MPASPWHRHCLCCDLPEPEPEHFFICAGDEVRVFSGRLNLRDGQCTGFEIRILIGKSSDARIYELAGISRRPCRVMAK